MTITELSKACFAMIEGASTEQRARAKRYYENEYMICRLHWLGYVQPRDKARNQMVQFYNWLIGQDLAKYM